MQVAPQGKGRTKRGAAAWAIATALLLAAVLTPFPSSGATVLTFEPIDDSFVLSTQATKNFGRNSKLRLDGKPRRDVLMKFVVSGVGSAPISRVTLSLHTLEGSPVGGSLHRVGSTTWTETTVTFANAPAEDAVPFAAIGPVTSGTRSFVDVGGLITGDGTFSLKIRSSSPDGADYASAEASVALRPSLEIEVAGPADAGPPTASITSPADGSEVAGAVDVAIAASDDIGVTGVELLVDGAPAGIDTGEPYSIPWDTTLASNGPHELIAMATDAVGNAGTSPVVSVTVNNAGDVEPPSAPTGLSANAAPGPRIDLSWNASTDNVGVVAYRVFRDGTHVGTTAETSFSDTTVASDQTYGYVVRAEDAAGLLSDPSGSVSVTTPPPGSSSFVFAAGGDHGANTKTAASLAALDGSGADFYLALGDLDYDETPTDEAWCDYVKSKLPTLGATFPFQVVAGNHEQSGGPDGYILNHAACLPDRLGATVAPGGFYGTDYYVDYPSSAPLARVVMISPDIWIEGVRQRYLAGSSWYTWLAAAIDGARNDGIPWVIVGMHKNCITTGEKSCEIGSDLLQLLVDRRVDLVLQGHDHNYQRSKQLALDAGSCPSVPIGAADLDCVADDGSDDVYPRGGGTVIVISGTIGGGSYGVSLADSEGPYFAALDSSTWGLTRFVVTEDRIDGNFMPSTGSFGDSFSIVQGAAAGADRSPPSRPTNLTATPTASTRVDLSWSPSVDDTTVEGYLVLRDGQHIGTTAATSFTDTGVVSGTTYSYTVRAVDGANNASDPSDPATATPGPPSQVLSFTVSADATLREGSPGSNFGTTPTVQVDGSPVKHLLLRFDVSGVGASQVAAARIRLHSVDPSVLGGDAFLAAGTSWSETGVNWNNAPAALPPQLDSLGEVVAGSWYTLDVTSAIAGDGTYTFRVSSASANGADYASREGVSGLAPTLEIELS